MYCHDDDHHHTHLLKIHVHHNTLRDVDWWARSLLALSQRLEGAGASVLCLHGRTVDQNKQLCGGANWDAIAEVARSLSIPVIANGGIATFDDVQRCLEHTGKLPKAL